MYNTDTRFDTNGHAADITIRLACPSDREALRTLAERDSRVLPAGAMLVAVIDDVIRAAVPIAAGEPIADPFRPSEELIGLLSARAEQLRGRGGSGFRARLGRALGGRSKRGLSPQPAGTLRAFD